MDDHYNGLADNSRKIWAVYTFLVWYDVYFGEQQKYASKTGMPVA